MRPQRQGHSNSSGAGSIGPIPPIGTSQHILFEDGTMYNGKYVSTPTTQTQKPPELSAGNDPTGQNYPNVHAFIDPAGNRHTYDYKRNTLDIEHASGAHLTIDGSGHIGIKTASNAVGKGAATKNSPGFTLQIQGPVSVVGTDVTIGGSGTTKIMSTGDVHLGAGGNLYLSAGGAIIAPKITLASPQVGSVPNVPAPPARTPPTFTAPADPTAAS